MKQKIAKKKSSRHGVVSMDPNLLVSDDYNVTLPKKLIREMKLSDGDDIVFIKHNNGNIEMKKA